MQWQNKGVACSIIEIWGFLLSYPFKSLIMVDLGCNRGASGVNVVLCRP